MEQLRAIGKKFDAYQKKHRFLAFPIAVVKRYGDDEGGKHAALITYYGFLSLFPLLLILITVLQMFVQNNPQLADQIVNNAVRTFPALGNDLRESVDTIDKSGLALVVQVLVLFYGLRGFANILQDTFNDLWHIEKECRPGFVPNLLRSMGMILSILLVIVVGTTLSYVLRSIFNFGPIENILFTILNIAIVFGLFLAIFRIGTANEIGLRKLMLGAAFASGGAILVQQLGGYIMSQQLERLNSSYGSFALALGILFWMYLQAQVILYAITITTVRTQHDWPKDLLD